MRLLYIPAFLLLVLFNSSCSKPAPQPPATKTVEPSLQELAERGKYLVEVMGCHDCHSPKIMGPNGPMNDPERLLSGHPANEMNPPQAPNANPGYVLFGMGGTTAVGPWGTSFSGNITSDATGIGTWSEEQFKRAITKGLYKGLEGSRQLLPPMPWENFKNITDADVHAIYTYLQSTKPVENVVPAPLPPAQQ
jgi:Cytochrome c